MALYGESRERKREKRKRRKIEGEFSLENRRTALMEETHSCKDEKKSLFNKQGFRFPNWNIIFPRAEMIGCELMQRKACLSCARTKENLHSQTFLHYLQQSFVNCDIVE